MADISRCKQNLGHAEIFPSVKESTTTTWPACFPKRNVSESMNAFYRQRQFLIAVRIAAGTSAFMLSRFSEEASRPY
jgi:hypothetical protein